MRIVIVTGMSGAGKSTALKMLEDAGYYCVDNMPIKLITKFVELATQNSDVERIALGIDIRSGQSLGEFDEILNNMEKENYSFEILFLDASDSVLVRRYKETRRNHPLSGAGRVDIGIQQEREELEFLRKRADYIINTSRLLSRELKRKIEEIFVNDKVFSNLYVTVLSFGFKYGIPNDADLVFDVRFLPNPYYIDELREKTGNDEEVNDFVMSNNISVEFLDKLKDLVNFLIPNYIAEGKNQLVIAIGCTGGKHRSVTIANHLAKSLSEGDIGIKVEHRDIEKDALRKR
ncbi:MAG: RNase adapter RapZ [Lachnospiraceae bacterium]|nr:RNase adapter RapZ [Lachnospira sp.]MBR6697156.1 RNase adapter RapZ [Lachnospiraceae bacterium]